MLNVCSNFRCQNYLEATNLINKLETLFRAQSAGVTAGNDGWKLLTDFKPQATVLCQIKYIVKQTNTETTRLV